MPYHKVRMTKCPHCGAVLDPGDTFCPARGKSCRRAPGSVIADAQAFIAVQEIQRV